MTTDNERATIAPASSGYFMPAEWGPHEATWLQWPSNRVEPGYEMKQERIWLEMVAALFKHEKVSIIVETSHQRDHVAYLLDYFGIGLDNVDLHVVSLIEDGGAIGCVTQPQPARHHHDKDLK